MELIIKSDREQACILGAKIIAGVMRKKPSAVLGLATGSTPLKVYSELIRMHQEEGLSFKQTTSFNLDEYVGLEADHPCSFKTEMYKNFFDKIDIPRYLINIPDGRAESIPAMCTAYEDKIKTCGGIDIQLLGVGHDGHLAFNEPGSSLRSRTRLKTLSHETLEANSRFFGSIDKVPRHCVTMGIGTILESRTCLLLAFGEDKAEAVHELAEGAISATWPASALQFHPHTIVLLDEAAASRLKRKQYYLDVYAGKPDWQRYE